jgi:hypothetical protein
VLFHGGVGASRRRIWGFDPATRAGRVKRLLAEAHFGIKTPFYDRLVLRAVDDRG